MFNANPIYHVPYEESRGYFLGLVIFQVVLEWDQSCARNPIAPIANTKRCRQQLRTILKSLSRTSYQLHRRLKNGGLLAQSGRHKVLVTVQLIDRLLTAKLYSIWVLNFVLRNIYCRKTGSLISSRLFTMLHFKNASIW